MSGEGKNSESAVQGGLANLRRWMSLRGRAKGRVSRSVSSAPRCGTCESCRGNSEPLKGSTAEMTARGRTLPPVPEDEPKPSTSYAIPSAPPYSELDWESSSDGYTRLAEAGLLDTRNREILIKTDDPTAFIEEARRHGDVIRIKYSQLYKLNDSTVLVETEPPCRHCPPRPPRRAAEPQERREPTPQIVIYDIGELTEEEICYGIEMLTGERPLKVRRERAPSGRDRAYVRLSRGSLRNLEGRDQDRVYIGRCRYFYARFVDVKHCFRCHRYGHESSRCPGDESELYVIGVVNAIGKCSNCFMEVVRGLRKDAVALSPAEIEEISKRISHKTHDRSCPVYKAKACPVKRLYQY